MPPDSGPRAPNAATNLLTFANRLFGAAYAAQACEETAAAKRRNSLSGRVDAAGRSVRLLHTPIAGRQ